MNPSEARPLDEKLFKMLYKTEYETEGPVPTKPDNTMVKVFEFNNISLPQTYTIHVENIFNIREKDSKKAKAYARQLVGVEDLMFRYRNLIDDYRFVFLAWGDLDINESRQLEIQTKYPDAIKVNKLNHKGNILDVGYPVHSLYMNTDYFLEASVGKIKPI